MPQVTGKVGGKGMEVMMLEVIASIELEMVAIMMLVILVMTIPDESKNF